MVVSTRRVGLKQKFQKPLFSETIQIFFAELKREFGRDLVFWGGGCDTQLVLPTGTPEEVRRHVREQVATMQPGGGFVFQQVHNVLANVPPQNIIAMFEALRS